MNKRSVSQIANTHEEKERIFAKILKMKSMSGSEQNSSVS